MPRLLAWLTALCLALPAGAEPAATETYTSPVNRVAVLELFTSHGCSSCPPADRWLRQLRERPDLWRGVVPVAFHVDYWDRLGWPDRFADPAFSARQRAYRRAGHVRSVYTPGLFLNGREWRGWFRGAAPDLSPGDPVGRLTLTVEPPGEARLRFSPVQGQRSGPLEAHGVVLGFDQRSAIGAGENAGRVLEEDFVVLAHRTAPASRDFRWRLPLPRPDAAHSAPGAVAAWVSRPGDPTPIQAVAGWLP